MKTLNPKILVFAMTLLTSVSSVQARDDDNNEERVPGCRRVHGRISTAITQAGCQSPFFVCTQGETFGTGLLRGTTYYTTMALGPTPIDPTFTSSFSYSGNLVISTGRGEIFVRDLGFVDQAGGAFSELSLDIGGTGRFAGASGHLFFFGKATGTGFEGDIQGSLCLAPKVHHHSNQGDLDD